MLNELVDSLGIERIPDSWKRNYERAFSCLPSEIFFLQDSYLDKVGQHVPLSESNAQLIYEAVNAIRCDEKLQELAWLWHYILYVQSDPERENLTDWPVPTTPFHEDVFPAVILLSGYERLEKIHKMRNIPKDIIHDTLVSVDSNMNGNRKRTGNPGLGMFYFEWLQYCFNAKLYRIGRLNFEMRTFSHPVRVFQNVLDGKVIALSDHGVQYRNDGLVDGTNDIFDKEQGWTATFTETSDQYSGYSIHPNGRVLQEKMHLSKAQWQLVLSSGDPVISVHIPGQGAFTHELCQEAFERAQHFFATHYADKQFRAMICISWLLDPQLQQWLDKSSNLLKFQKWFDLYPVKSSDSGIYRFVFRCERGKVSINELPESTSLQRNIKRFMQAGGRMQNTGGFFLLNEPYVAK